MIFGQEYYEEIWGSVHRHDYCPYWRDRLIHEFGKCRILDIGCGCGHLVKLLRESGCDAWGVEISDYAIQNSCVPCYVVKGNATDLPFKNERFDLVFSQGLMEYIAEEDVPKVRDEFWRVGAAQHHEIDHDKCDYRPDFVTWKSQEWWNAQLAAPKVLISCPTHECKEYSHQAWIDNIRKTDYPNFEIFVVDNSPTPDCFHRWKDRIPMVHIDTPSEWDSAQRVAASMEITRQKFLRENFKWWWNVESDIIPDPHTLKVLIKHAGDWTGHAFPGRGQTEQVSSGLGCSLFSRRLMEDFTFIGAGDALCQHVDSFFWNWVRPQNKYQVVELWGYGTIHHLKEPESVAYAE